MEILSGLFGGLNRVKLLRFFILSPEIVADLDEIESLVKVNQATVRKEVKQLIAIDFLTEKLVSRSNARGDRKIKVKVWQLNNSFPFVQDLRSILSHNIVEDRLDVSKKFRGCGRLKLIILSGIFMNDALGRVDLTVVGDDLERKKIERVIHKIEAEFGKEIKYAILDTEDFHFRMFSGDKFIRDIYDYPYEYALNKLGI
jgi:hypothetical protein